VQEKEMVGVDLDHPEVIFVKRLDGTGYGFFYSTPAQFDDAANGFMGPLNERMAQEAEETNINPKNAQELRYNASIAAMENVFKPNWDDLSAIDATRCVAASCVLEKEWDTDVPQCIVIEQAGDDIILREGFEFLEHPGYPIAIIIGSKEDGGGLATFYDSIEEFIKGASKPASQSQWLPQLIYRLYIRTPSIMTGIPTAPEEKGKGVGVECHAYTLNRKGKLIERRKRS
jgi:hypothetical protein